MKKICSIALAALLLCATILPVAVLAADPAAANISVYVTISDQNGDLAVKQEAITVTDTDSDGKFTIHDALYCAHELKYKGGAAAGYASASGSFGLSLTKLWGCENGGSYGYYVNNVQASELGNEIKEGDYINAFVYTDLTTYSDAYCYFDCNRATVAAGSSLTVTLTALTYAADFSLVQSPVSGAVITLNGAETEYQTDAEGKVTLQLNEIGKVEVSAKSSTMTLVPNLLIVTVSEKTPDAPATGDASVLMILVAASALAAACVLAVSEKRHEI